PTHACGHMSPHTDSHHHPHPPHAPPLCSCHPRPTRHDIPLGHTRSPTPMSTTHREPQSSQTTHHMPPWPHEPPSGLAPPPKPRWYVPKCPMQSPWPQHNPKMLHNTLDHHQQRPEQEAQVPHCPMHSRSCSHSCQPQRGCSHDTCRDAAPQPVPLCLLTSPLPSHQNSPPHEGHMQSPYTSPKPGTTTQASPS
ncbi:hypothetical protein K439DRAFT_1353024, partial [Ramaria rubella]